MSAESSRIVDRSAIDLLRGVVGADFVVIDPDALENYAHDETPGYSMMPLAAVKPLTTAEVSAVMKIAHERALPVTPRGGGTSLSAGAVPAVGGIVLSLERMNRIKEIDPVNCMVTVEPGVITGELDKALRPAGFFFPPDPVSLDSCTIGGNIAECAGGPRAMKYGVTKNYVTGLEVVWPGGGVSRLGGKLLKNVTGYDLIGLIVGSEGTLAVVTEATLRVLPRPREIVDLLIPMDGAGQAVAFTRSVLAAGSSPAVIEFMDGEVVRAVAAYLDKKVPFSEAGAQLIVELDGDDRERMRREYERIGEMALAAGAKDVIVGESVSDRERIWEARRKVGEALKSRHRVVAREDLVVPRDAIPELIERLRACARSFRGTLFAFGHLGDGNIHADFSAAGAAGMSKPEILEMRREIYRITVGMGGTITAEHGVGLSKVGFIELALDAGTISRMKQVKKLFDPKNILNPGKIFP